MKKLLSLVVLLVLLFPLLAACGGDDVATQVAEQAPTAVEQIEEAIGSETPIAELVPTAVQEVQQAATEVARSPEAGATEGAGTPTLAELPVQTPIGAVANPTEITPTEGEIGTVEPTVPSARTVYTKNNPPAVDMAESARRFQGQKITYYGDTVGIGRDLDQILAKQFTQQTGIQVEVVPKPESATESFSTYQRFFQAKDPGVDVMMLDVIWPGAFAPHLVDLKPELANLAEMHYQGIIENNTVDGKLVAMPWFGDFGMLYYRMDLLEKYGYNSPPKTWDELEQMAQKVMEGERADKREFTGFVFQGASYEGLTCNGSLLI